MFQRPVYAKKSGKQVQESVYGALLGGRVGYHGGMASRRKIRELAMQAVYQFDARASSEVSDTNEIELAVQDAPLDDEAKTEAFALAKAAWAVHDQADALASALSESWPTHRQPVVDRSIMRLAFYEMASGLTPVRVVLNESVELAKSYGGEKSPSFVNGVLDKMLKRIEREGIRVEQGGGDEVADPWLADAINEEGASEDGGAG